MATRRNDTDTVKKKAAPASSKAAPRKAVPAKAPVARKAGAPRKASPAAVEAPAPAERIPATPVPDAATAKTTGKGLLHAGLKALGSVRDDVVLHQGNVIETLLGITQGKKKDKADKPDAKPRGLAGLDPFGIRKFEDVFDQRVATALQHLGMPSAAEFQELREQMKLLLELLQRAEAAADRKR